MPPTHLSLSLARTVKQSRDAAKTGAKETKLTQYSNLSPTAMRIIKEHEELIAHHCGANDSSCSASRLD